MKRITITIPEQLYKKARELGVNKSRAARKGIEEECKKLIEPKEKTHHLTRKEVESISLLMKSLNKRIFELNYNLEKVKKDKDVKEIVRLMREKGQDVSIEEQIKLMQKINGGD